MADEATVETLTDLGMLEAVRLRVCEEDIVGFSNEKVVEDDRVLVTVREADGERSFRIETQWAHGWLEPIVDELQDDERRPVGSLSEVEALGYG
jgi:hypothetical protein